MAESVNSKESQANTNDLISNDMVKLTHIFGGETRGRGPFKQKEYLKENSVEVKKNTIEAILGLN